MVVRFRDRSLRRCYVEHKEGIKRWNKKVARLYVQRVNILQTCSSVEDLATLPQLRFHPLTGKQRGCHAINLDGFWRLIVSVDETGQEVRGEEVSKHYDD